MCLPSRSSPSDAGCFKRNLFPQHRNNTVARGQHDLPEQRKLEERSMRFETQWSGDAIAAPFCPVEDREDRFFEDPGDKSWNHVDSRADADPTAAVKRSIRHAEPVLSSSRPNRRGRWVTVVMSLVIDHLIEGFALSATTLHPEFALPASEKARRERETGIEAYGPWHALRPREAMSPAGAHGSSRSLHFSPRSGRECSASARSVISERPGR
jgi:hypothetical protein